MSNLNVHGLLKALEDITSEYRKRSNITTDQTELATIENWAERKVHEILKAQKLKLDDGEGIVEFMASAPDIEASRRWVLSVSLIPPSPEK
jgi:hypothetical protein